MTDTRYAAAADTYWSKGWRGVLPLPPRHKHAPPRGFTGKAGLDPSYPDLLSWVELYPDGNLCLRMPDDVIGIDVDAYGAKTGAATIAEAQKRWGRLPATVRSTSRDDGVSGIRLYRVPAGQRFVEGIEFAELGIGDIEICQRSHRYVITWPSIHPEGREYWWHDDSGALVGIPEPGELPELPGAWIDALSADTAASTSNNTDGRWGQFPTAAALTSGEPSTAVADRMRQAIRELNLPGQSRHDTCRGHVLALLRHGKNGQPGVEAALHALGEMFVALIAPDRAGGRDEAIREYKAMVTGDGAARELAAPSPTDWIRASVVENLEVAAPRPEPVPAVEPACHLAEIERGFWDARASLQTVWTAAMARMCSPWAVLAHTAARALTTVRPHTTLPPLIGGPGSLNFFAAVTAASGGGKGSAAAAARTLVPEHVEQRNLGSGEGIVAAFGRPLDDGDPTPLHEAIMFTADEIDTITALNNRSGSTTMSILRSGFSGETLGFSYAAREKRRHIEAHSYRMTLIVSVQPERAGGLMADAGGGTPQRFMWFPGTDPRITADPPWPPGALSLPSPDSWLHPCELTVPDEARRMILDERVKAMRGQADALDGHALFVREKFAFALAVLDGRTAMNVEDWELAGIAADVSTYTRELVLDTLRDAAGRDAAERGSLRGIEMDAADVERGYQQTQRMQRVLRWLIGKLDEAGPDGMTRREAQRAAASRDRQMVDIAIQVAVRDGLVEQVEGTTKLVRMQ